MQVTDSTKFVILLSQVIALKLTLFDIVFSYKALVTSE